MSVGTRRTRIEGSLKVTGAAIYAADNYPAGLLHAMLVGSPRAAGTVTAIDTARAEAVPGVTRVITRADMPPIAPISIPWAITRIPLTTDVIEWEGQPVAIVLAETSGSRRGSSVAG